MVKYRRIEHTKKDGAIWYGYTKNYLMVDSKRVPGEVLEKLTNPEYSNTIDYDDQPDKRRCTACEAPQSRQKYLNGITYDLCEWHYQHMRLGQLAAVVRQLEEEQEAKRVQAKEVKESKKTVKKTKRRKTALSQVIA